MKAKILIFIIATVLVTILAIDAARFIKHAVEHRIHQINHASQH